MRRNFFICLLLAGITLMIYWPARHYGIVNFDDPMFVTKNPDINGGLTWHSLWWAFSHTLVANWHPVTSLSFVVGHQIWGTKPGVEHMVNVIFHAANAVLLFLVLLRMTECPWRSFVVAALFAWHPLRVESVAWIAERKDVLCGFFFLLTLFFYTRYAQSKVERRTVFAMLRRAKESSAGTGGQSLVPRLWSLDYYLALAFFALALMSKPMAVTLPFVLLLLDVWPLGRISERGVRNAELKSTRQSQGAAKQSKDGSILNHLIFEKWPFFGLAILVSGLTYWIQMNSPAMASLNELGVGLRFDNAVMSYLRYLAKAVWPTDLAVEYPLPLNNHSDFAPWPDWEIWTAVSLLLMISAFCIRLIPRKPYLAVGWFWYLGTMLPVIGLVQVGGQGMADRYTYLPLIGPAISLVWLVPAKWNSGIFPRTLLATVAAAFLAACVLLSRHQVRYWKDTVSLFEHTVDATGENAFAQFIWGSALEDEGRVSEAMVHYRIAMKSNPTVKEAYWGLGRLLAQQGKWAEAEKPYAALLRFMPDDSTAHQRLAVILPHLGREAEAIQHLETVLQKQPDALEALNNLAWTLATSPEADLRDGPRAVQLAGHACEITGSKQTIYVGTLAAAYAEAGRFDEAVATGQKACALAEKNHEPELLQKNKELLELYLAHQAYHEAASPVLTKP